MQGIIQAKTVDELLELDQLRLASSGLSIVFGLYLFCLVSCLLCLASISSPPSLVLRSLARMPTGLKLMLQLNYEDCNN